MTNPQSEFPNLKFDVFESSQVGEARRAASRMAHALGFDETETGKAALVTTEAASNLAKHATGGELLLRPLERGSRQGIEILALDRGPGMANLSRSLRDGHSTAGTPGSDWSLRKPRQVLTPPAPKANVRWLFIRDYGYYKIRS